MASTPINIAQCSDLILEKLYETGQIFWLRRFLTNRLIRHGWSGNLRWLVVDYIRERGPDNVNISHMWSDLAKVGLDSTPEQVRNEVKNFLRTFAASYIEIDEAAELPPELEEDEKLYEMQSRDATPEPSTGMYPPSPSSAGLPKNAPPPWMFVYDGNRSPTSSSTTESEPLVGDSDNTYDSSSSSSTGCDSPRSHSSSTPPGEQSQDLIDDEFGEPTPDPYQDGVGAASPIFGESSGAAAARKKDASAKIKDQQQQRDKDRKRRPDKKQRDRQQLDKAAAATANNQVAPTSFGRVTVSRERLLKKEKTESYEDRKMVASKLPGAGPAGRNNPAGVAAAAGGNGNIAPALSPQLAAPLRQLKLDKRSVGSPTSSGSKLSPKPGDRKEPTRKTEIIEEEEEELMDV